MIENGVDHCECAARASRRRMGTLPLNLPRDFSYNCPDGLCARYEVLGIPGISRRRLLARIGKAAGSAAMYQAMNAFGLTAESDYNGPIRLEGGTKGTSVLILGAGLAGLVAALELRKAGYKVQVLEARSRAGGRCRTLRGGDEQVELGFSSRTCAFDKDLYFNPGPWRIPYHHRALLDYCRRLGVPLEPFVQVNHNAYLHASQAFGGHPQRYRHVQADFYGCIAELLAKAAPQSSLSQAVTREERDKLLEALRFWGALDKNYAYREGAVSSARRGYGRKPGGGLRGVPQPSKPIAPRDLLKSDLWRHLAVELFYNFQTTLFQPAGGMDRIADAFTREVGDVFTFGAKAISIGQDEHGVAVTYRDAKTHGLEKKVHADWCVCTLPLSILRAIDLSVGRDLHDAIRAVPYASATKVGLQFKRRFWEEDEEIYGGITFTDLPIAQIGYPNGDYLSTGKGVLAGRLFLRRRKPGIRRLIARRASEESGRIRCKDSPTVREGVRERHRRRVAERPLGPRLLQSVVRRDQKAALQGALRDRWPHRSGRRARLVCKRVAGGRSSIFT